MDGVGDARLEDAGRGCSAWPFWWPRYAKGKGTNMSERSLKAVAKALAGWVDASPTECADGRLLPKGAGFPAGDALREMRLQRVLANTTYFRHYPNPTHNPIVEQLCQSLDTVGMSGNFLSGKDPLKHFSSGETFLPRSKKKVDAHYAKPLVEVIEEALDALFADTSFTRQQREEAAEIAAAMEDELLFYDELRAQARRQAEAGDNTFMLRAFRKLVPIWVAKQDCRKAWAAFSGNRGPGAKPVVLAGNMAPNLFGSRFFDTERWWGCCPGEAWGEGEGDEALASEPINDLIDVIVRNDEGRLFEGEMPGERFKAAMVANRARYVALVEAAAQPGGAFVPNCVVADPRGGTVQARELFAELPVADLYRSFDAAWFPEALKRKVNLVFGVYLAPVVGIVNCRELPFSFAGEDALDEGTVEATDCMPRGMGGNAALGVGASPVTVSVSHALLGSTFTASKAIEFPANEVDVAGGALLCIVGRRYDSSKWDALRRALSDAAQAYFGVSSSEGALADEDAGALGRERADTTGEDADAEPPTNAGEGALAGEGVPAGQGLRGVSYAERFVDQGIDACFGANEARWVPLVKRLVHEECFSADNHAASLDFGRLRDALERVVQRFRANLDVMRTPEDAPSKTTLRKRLYQGGNSIVAALEAQELESLHALAKRVEWNSGAVRLTQLRSEDEYGFADYDAVAVAKAVVAGADGIAVTVRDRRCDVSRNQLLAQLRACVAASVPSAFGETGKRLFTPAIMDFLTCGVLAWAESEREKTLPLLETCLAEAFNRFVEFEKRITLECRPDGIELDGEGAKHLRAISSRHLVFFLDERNECRFNVTCLDAKNGAIIDTAEAPTQFALSRIDATSARRLDRARQFAGNPALPLAKAGEAFALSPFDVIEIPAYEGVVVRIGD